jgi:hypothetical protein
VTHDPTRGLTRGTQRCRRGHERHQVCVHVHMADRLHCLVDCCPEIVCSYTGCNSIQSS